MKPSEHAVHPSAAAIAQTLGARGDLDREPTFVEKFACALALNVADKHPGEKWGDLADMMLNLLSAKTPLAKIVPSPLGGHTIKFDIELIRHAKLTNSSIKLTLQLNDVMNKWSMVDGMATDHVTEREIENGAALFVMKRTLTDPSLTAHDKREIARNLDKLMGGRRHRFEFKGADGKTYSLSNDTLATEASKEIAEWLAGQLKVERPDGSSFHKLVEETRAGRLMTLGEATPREYAGSLDEPHQIFVLEHDWAGAFAKAAGLSGEWRLPYDKCCFEMLVSGKRVCACVYEDDQKMRRYMLIFVRATDGWCCEALYLHHAANDSWAEPLPRLVADKWDRLAALIGAQLRAVSIALGAEVATKEIVRTPHKLNQARERRGRLPLFDYHVVTLSRRSRAAPVPTDLKDRDRRASPRLHFRRGHNRNYKNYRLWVEWQLVGDPDLGFIDKHYKL